MEVKCLEVRDEGTFIPVICLKPMPENEGQRYLLRRDGYSCDPKSTLVIVIKGQCRGVSYDPYHWPGSSRTMQQAHRYIQDNWNRLKDGDVVCVEHILGERAEPKRSERESLPL